MGEDRRGQLRGGRRLGNGRVGKGRVGKGRVGKGRVGNGRVGNGRVGNGRLGNGSGTEQDRAVEPDCNSLASRCRASCVWQTDTHLLIHIQCVTFSCNDTNVTRTRRR